MSAIIAAVLFMVVIVMCVFLILGAPIGEFTMGGRYRVLPKKLRIVGAAMLVIQIFGLLIILQAGGYLTLWFSVKVTRVICYVYGGYLVINMVMNALSSSKKEKYTMVPFALITAVCFFITASQLK